MTMEGPALSVILPVYNGGAYLAASIQCILDQTFTDFELIIIDDGSTDKSGDVIRGFSDDRIRVITQVNQGLARTLNTGIAAAQAPLIARQDQDDISLSDRFAKQIAFLRTHPEIQLLGTWATITDQSGNAINVHEHPTDDEEIRFQLLFDNPFVHASVMFTRSLFDTVGGYDPDPAVFEDFDLWSRMVRHTRTANLPEHLVLYREVSTSISRISTVSAERVLEQRRRNLHHFFPGAPSDLLATAAAFGHQQSLVTIRQFISVRALFDAFIKTNVPTSSTASAQRKRLRNGMFGYRIITGNGILQRHTDRLLKGFLLLWSDLFPGRAFR